MPKNQNGQNSSQVSCVAQAFDGYKGGEEMPLASYATLLGIYNTAFAALLLAANNSKRQLPERVGYADLMLLGVATYELSRIIAKDRVTSPLRAPFTEYVEPAGESEVKEKVRGRGMQRAIGDLVTCPYCLSPWVGAALTFGLVFRPRAARLVMGTFAAAAISGFLLQATDAIKEEKK
ncbi:MAG: DUF1360 domain-containing protein [Pyrinomonadaceae bacterium MAG19_C2-C3]|nr:DUF1360 domain-containing protein [Pyrinomonadaceae bacterium MAG19_C2-C3]